MDGQTLQSKVYAGFDKAAQRVGLSYAIHRPSGANNPVSGASVGSIYAAFTAGPNYLNPNKYGNPAWYGTLDGSQVNVGDYLVGESTYFIAAKQHLLPVYAVQCNRTISVKRPKQMTGVGAGGYGGNSLADETVMLSGWPASVLQGTKGEKNETDLPGDVRSPWWLILLPAYASVTLNSSDIMTDDLNRRYVISSAELTDMGWRITAMQAQA
jgi:hypothetical protein